MGSIAMKTADHLLLGQYLVERCGTPHLRCHRRAFLLGCVEPDYNVFSYCSMSWCYPIGSLSIAPRLTKRHEIAWS